MSPERFAGCAAQRTKCAASRVGGMIAESYVSSVISSNYYFVACVVLMAGCKVESSGAFGWIALGSGMAGLTSYFHEGQLSISAILPLLINGDSDRKSHLVIRGCKRWDSSFAVLCGITSHEIQVRPMILTCVFRHRLADIVVFNLLRAIREKSES